MQSYPLHIKKQESNALGVLTRATERGRPINIGKSSLTSKTCVSDAVRIWNQAPVEVTGSMSLYMVKKAIKRYVKSLPI